MTTNIIHKFIYMNEGMNYKKYALPFFFSLVLKQQFIPDVSGKYKGNKH